MIFGTINIIQVVIQEPTEDTYSLIEYATIQPMPLVFLVTGVILLLGIISLSNSLKQK